MNTESHRYSRLAAGGAVRFIRARSGSAALIFGLAFIPMMLGIGVAIDYARAVMIKSKLQAATDAAALAAGAQPKLTQRERQAIATNKVLVNLGGAADSLDVAVTESEPAAGVFRVQARASMKTALMKFANFPSQTVTAKSEASLTIGSEAFVEIALALDNTGSMRDDMPALKSAAKTLVQSVMGDGSNGRVRVSVVPYVAAVNPGLTDMSFVDKAAVAPTTGNWFNWAWLGYDKDCTPKWNSDGGGSGPGHGGSGDAAGDANDLIDLLNPFRRLARELLGVNAAFAAEITPNTIPPLTFQDLTSKKKRTYKAPVGFNLQEADAGSGGCDWIMNPPTVSPYELFNRTLDDKGKAVAWKGCVEARANAAEIAAANAASGASYTTGVDFDVTDAPPSPTDPASLFTPYFWPDEPDYDWRDWSHAAPGKWTSGSTTFHNNYMADYSVPESWNWVASSWSNGHGVLKYDRTTRSAIVKETAPDTYGPNAACPEPLTRLTNNRSQVLSAIEAMNFWYNGGTVISEGLSWAWRTLSPERPYADGAPYANANAKKIIVLMTDGVNGLAENGNAAGAGVSDYSAYGYLGGSRLNRGDNVSTYAQLQTFLDNRLKKACDNAKAKGVSIYTVMFNHNGLLSAAGQAHSTALLSYCASKPENAFVTTDSRALSDAFANIALSATATPLRLTK